MVQQFENFVFVWMVERISGWALEGHNTGASSKEPRTEQNTDRTCLLLLQPLFLELLNLT